MREKWSAPSDFSEMDCTSRMQPPSDELDEGPGIVSYANGSSRTELIAKLTASLARFADDSPAFRVELARKLASAFARFSRRNRATHAELIKRFVASVERLSFALEALRFERSPQPPPRGQHGPSRPSSGSAIETGHAHPTQEEVAAVLESIELGHRRRTRTGEFESSAISEGDVRIFDAFIADLSVEAANEPRPPSGAEQQELNKIAAATDRLRAMPPAVLFAERARRLESDQFEDQ